MRGLFPAANSMPCNQSWQSNSLRYGADCIKMTVDFFNEKRDIWSRKEAEAMEKNNQEKARVVHQVKPIPAATPRRERVAAYCRVSSGKDAMLHSLSAQVSHYSTYIQKHPGWEYAGVYADEAYTGTKDTRPQFRCLLEECRAKRIDRILTKSVSRFARNTVTLLETVRELRALGVAVYFEEQNIDSLSEDGELMLTILASFAQAESKSVSDNCKWRIRKDFSEGKPVNLSLIHGYRQENGKIEIDPEEAAVVRRVFSEYLQGKGTLQIANLLQREGIPRRFGGQWCASSVREMLINEKYTGDALLQKTYSENHLTKKKIRNHGELTQYYAENTHPAIIDHETFERVQLERAARWASENVQNPTYARYLFSGRVVCGNCGAHYNRRTQTNGRGTPRRITWQCVTYSTKGKRACPAKQIPERTLMELTCEVLETGELTEETMNRLSEIRITGPNQVRFLFLDGRMVEKVWQDRSRAESWTDEMKQRASEQMKRRHQHE